LADRYTRVSPKELFGEDKDLSIRQLVNQHVVAALRQVKSTFWVSYYSCTVSVEFISIYNKHRLA